MIIQIRDLNIKTRIGTTEEEVYKVQDLIIFVTIEVPSISGDSDDISDTVDYDEISEKIINFTRSNTFKLIEYLAKQIGSMVLKHQNALSVGVEVHKKIKDLYLAVATYNESRN